MNWIDEKFEIDTLHPNFLSQRLIYQVFSGKLQLAELVYFPMAKMAKCLPLAM